MSLDVDGSACVLGRIHRARRAHIHVVAVAGLAVIRGFRLGDVHDSSDVAVAVVRAKGMASLSRRSFTACRYPRYMPNSSRSHSRLFRQRAPLSRPIQRQAIDAHPVGAKFGVALGRLGPTRAQQPVLPITSTPTLPDSRSRPISRTPSMRCLQSPPQARWGFSMPCEAYRREERIRHQKRAVLEDMSTVVN
ncbi:hypothetical protein C8T65DRAFT_21878 [Cerioporus squamosus]|nr:hypothetical protein C8T65DRAFT_21878 [Cerioporus squamosus]